MTNPSVRKIPVAPGVGGIVYIRYITMADSNLELTAANNRAEREAAARLSTDATKPPPSYLHDAVKSVAARFTSDEQTQETATTYATGFLKTAAIFMPGRAGYGLSAIVHGADQASAHESLGLQATDFALGAAKGLALRKALDVFGAQKMDPALTGMAMGMLNRAVDVTATRQTYMDKTGAFSFSAAQKNFGDTVFNTSAIGIDVLSFGIADGALRGIRGAFGTTGMQRPLYRNMLMGTTFGMSTGGFGELQRQQQEGEGFDGGKLLRAAVIQGGLDGLAGAIGGWRAEAPDRKLERIARKFDLNIDFEPLKPQPERLKTPQVVSEDVTVRTRDNGPWTSDADFAERGTRKVQMDMRHYGVEGHDVQIRMPEYYAKELDAGTNPNLANRLRPSDIPALMDALPNSRYIQKVLLADTPNVQDDYISQTYKKGFKSAMGIASKDLQTYQQERTSWLRRDFQHEWSHQLRYEYWDDPIAFRFKNAVDHDGNWVPKEYARRNNGEQWAVLGERMLGGSGRDFVEAAQNAPLRSVVYMSALQKSLAEVPVGERSPYHEHFARRAQWVMDNVRPVALERLGGMGTTQGVADLTAYIKELK